MRDEERTDFAAEIRRLGLIYGREVVPQLVAEYFQAMRHLDLGSVRRAVSKAVQATTFFPKPAELIEWAQSSTPPHYTLVDGVRTFACLRCFDGGVLYDRTAFGHFARPCTCAAGKSVAAAWEVPNTQGRIFADGARRNGKKRAEIETKIRERRGAA